jgi:hypothetical protein
MAIGKPVNKKSFYGSDGSVPDIAMPPEGYQLGGPQEEQKVVDNPPSISEESKDSLFAVPNQVPDEVTQEMDHQDEEDENDDSLAPERDVRAKPAVKGKTAQDNFKELRLAKEKAERERDALLAQMMATQYKPQQQQMQQVQEPEQDFDVSIDEDALVEGKYVNQIAKEIKSLKSQLKNYQSQTKEVAVESRIKAAFPDFEKVVSSENVELLNYQYPEVAESLRDTKDLYSKAAAAYKIMKTFGIHKDIYEDDRMKAIKNSQKPRPLASVSPQQGDSPLSKANAFANGMTEELKAQLRKEMNEARRRM